MLSPCPAGKRLCSRVRVGALRPGPCPGWLPCRALAGAVTVLPSLLLGCYSFILLGEGCVGRR